MHMTRGDISPHHADDEHDGFGIRPYFRWPKIGNKYGFDVFELVDSGLLVECVTLGDFKAVRFLEVAPGLVILFGLVGHLIRRSHGHDEATHKQTRTA